MIYGWLVTHNKPVNHAHAPRYTYILDCEKKKTVVAVVVAVVVVVAGVVVVVVALPERTKGIIGFIPAPQR